jgi:hypothetical protein
MDWQKLISQWEERFNWVTSNPVNLAWLDEAQLDVGKLPADLASFYQHSNGLSCEWLEVIAIEDPNSSKQMWNGLRNANDPERTTFLEGDSELLQRFLVFASLDAGQCAVIDRNTAVVWYEENNELAETTLTIEGFIETCLREVKNL